MTPTTKVPKTQATTQIKKIKTAVTQMAVWNEEVSMNKNTIIFFFKVWNVHQVYIKLNKTKSSSL